MQELPRTDVPATLARQAESVPLLTAAVGNPQTGRPQDRPETLPAEAKAGETVAAAQASAPVAQPQPAGARSSAPTSRDDLLAVQFSDAPGEDDAEAAGLSALTDSIPRIVAAPARPAQAETALPPGTGHRLAEALAQFPDRPVEVTLTPEELGRVRMTLTAQDASLVLTIDADRPETLDLLRRHIESLAQDFRDLGFADVDFRFSGGGYPKGSAGGSGTTSAVHEPFASESAAMDHAGPATPRAPRNSAAAGGLDLRL